MSLRGGLFKNPAYKELTQIDDWNQLLVTRSLADALIGGNAAGPQVRGVDLIVGGEDTPLHLELAGTTVNPSQILISKALETTALGTARLGANARVDYKVFGDWIDAHDLTGVNSGKHDLLDIGGGFTYDRFNNGDVYRGTVDAQYQTAHKWTIFGAAYVSHLEYHLNPAGPNTRTDYGGVAEGGYLLNNNLQLVARYSLTRSDPNFKVVGSAVFHEVAGGANFYLGEDGFFGNHAKLSVDVDYLPNGSPPDGDLLYITTIPGKGRLVFRAQFQAWF